MAGLDVPEKFVVKNEAGEVDHAATAKKMAESYRHLEKRVGTGDLPPKTAAEYQIQRRQIEGMEQATPEAMAPIMERMHGLKLTNAQLQGVMDIYDDLVEQGQTITQEKAAAATDALKKSWGDQYDGKLADANFALATVTTPEERQQIAKRYGADPVIIKLLATLGGELRESPMTGMSDAAMETIDDLRASEAYRNPQHPEHKRVTAKVAEAYKQGYKARH